jgi:hypothetical protein
MSHIKIVYGIPAFTVNRFKSTGRNILRRHNTELLLSKYICVLTDTYSLYLAPCAGGADKSLVRPGKKQTTATEDFDVNISYL